jgi:hypothetical protein
VAVTKTGVTRFEVMVAHNPVAGMAAPSPKKGANNCSGLSDKKLPDKKPKSKSGL